MRATGQKTILYVHVPGLLALSIRRQANTSNPINATCPLVVTEGRVVRDACPQALKQGVQVGASVVQARRLCPSLLAVPQEEVDAAALSRVFLEVLAGLSPTVEPEAADAAYADLTGTPVSTDEVCRKINEQLPLCPTVGMGVSRLAARACAKSGVQQLEEADVEWLWPDDPAVTGRLRRLGLATFGAVAAVSEDALRLHFGRLAPLLHRRAHGIDLSPVRPLYPPPFVDVVMDCGEAPVDNSPRLKHVIARAALRAERELYGLGVGRHLTLHIRTERGEVRQEWAVPVPLERAADVERAAWRMLGLMRLPAPVTSLRILIEDVSIPAAHTANLFAVKADAVALEAVRRRLAARFGLTTLHVLGQQPRTSREKRRAMLAENADAFRRLTL